MRRATTIGFAVDEKDRARLEHLASVFGGGNRSAFLRKAMEVMERLESASRLVQLQAYGEERLTTSGHKLADIPEVVGKVLANPHPAAVAQAKLIVASLRDEFAVAPRSQEHHPAADLYADLLAGSTVNDES